MLKLVSMYHAAGREARRAGLETAEFCVRLRRDRLPTHSWWIMPPLEWIFPRASFLELFFCYNRGRAILPPSEAIAMVASKVTNRYPRAGERMAPYTVREFLMEPIPAPLAEKLGGSGPETLRPGRDGLGSLSGGNPRRTCADHRRAHFGASGPQGVSTSPLSAAAGRALIWPICIWKIAPAAAWSARALTRTSRPWATIRSARFLSMRAFGPRCLVDLLSALESQQTTGPAAEHGRSSAFRGPRWPSIEPRRPRSWPNCRWPRSVRSDDPRFSLWMHAVDVEARTARDLAERLWPAGKTRPTRSMPPNRCVTCGSGSRGCKS